MSSLLDALRLFLPGTAVASTGSIESAVVDLHVVQIESFCLQLSSGGAADVKIELKTSPDGVTYDDYGDHVITASTNTDFGATPTGMHPYAVSTPLGRYVKFKITGVGSNAATTKIASCAVMLREQT